MADASISVELSRHITDIIGFLQRSTGQNDVIQFRLDWLYNAVDDVIVTLSLLGKQYWPLFKKGNNY